MTTDFTKQRVNVIARIVRTIAHSSTSDDETLNAARGLRRIAADDPDGVVQRLLAPPEVVVSRFMAPSVLQKRADQLESRTRTLEAENIRLARTVSDLAKTQQTDRNYIQELRAKFEAARQHGSDLNKTIHRLASKANVECPCDGCKRKLTVKAPPKEKQERQEPKQDQKINRRHGKVWTWERFRFLSIEHAKLGTPHTDWYDQDRMNKLITLCQKHFSGDGLPMPSFSKNAMISALTRLRDDPTVKEPPEM